MRGGKGCVWGTEIIIDPSSSSFHIPRVIFVLLFFPCCCS